MDAEMRQQPTTNEGAYNSNDKIADNPKPGALHDLAGRHPAMRPTPNMIRRLSFDMCIFVFSRRRCHVHPFCLSIAPGTQSPDV